MYMSEENSHIADKAKGVLETLLDKMGVNASVIPHSEPFIEQEEEPVTSPIAFDIKGEDLGILIGRHGQTLASLQSIVRLITTRQTQSWVPIVIDVEGYKQRRYQSLKTLAWRIAEQVKERKTPFKLEPMPAYERRIVHITLANDPDVTTDSIGEGETRRVVISLK